MNIASLILRPDLGFFALTAFQSFKRPSLSFGSSSRISLRRQSFSVSRPRLRPPGNIHNRSRLLLTNKIRPLFAAMSFDDFAITVPHRLTTNSSVRFYMMFLDEKIKVFALPSRGSATGNHQQPDVRGGSIASFWPCSVHLIEQYLDVAPLSFHVMLAERDEPSPPPSGPR